MKPWIAGLLGAAVGAGTVVAVELIAVNRLIGQVQRTSQSLDGYRLSLYDLAPGIAGAVQMIGGHLTQNGTAVPNATVQVQLQEPGQTTTTGTFTTDVNGMFLVNFTPATTQPVTVTATYTTPSGAALQDVSVVSVALNGVGMG